MPHCRVIDFSRGKVNVIPASPEQRSRLRQSSCHAVIAFCCVHRTTDLQRFSVGRITPKSAIHIWGSRPHLIYGSLGPLESAPKPHVDRLSRFFRAHERDQQTNTQTDHATPSIGCILLFLRTAAFDSRAFAVSGPTC